MGFLWFVFVLYIMFNCLLYNFLRFWEIWGSFGRFWEALRAALLNPSQSFSILLNASQFFSILSKKTTKALHCINLEQCNAFVVFLIHIINNNSYAHSRRPPEQAKTA